jgi:hypothetical protein
MHLGAGDSSISHGPSEWSCTATAVRCRRTGGPLSKIPSPDHPDYHCMHCCRSPLPFEWWKMTAQPHCLSPLISHQSSFLKWFDVERVIVNQMLTKNDSAVSICANSLRRRLRQSATVCQGSLPPRDQVVPHGQITQSRYTMLWLDNESKARTRESRTKQWKLVSDDGFLCRERI